MSRLNFDQVDTMKKLLDNAHSLTRLRLVHIILISNCSAVTILTNTVYTYNVIS